MNMFNSQPIQNWQAQPQNGFGMGNTMQPQYQQPYPQQFNQQPVPNWNRPTVQATSAVPSYPSIPGRMVSNPQEIRANEVMMDGTPSFFPMNDYSCIYAKGWDANGNIQTLKFVPEKTEQAAQGSSNFDILMERLDNIEKMLQSNQKGKNSYYKKEADSNGN